MKTTWLRRLGGALLLAAVVGACGSSGGNGGASDTTVTGDQPQKVATIQDKRAAGVPTRPACASTAKPSSAVGVTADSVNVGVLFLDIKKLASLGFAVDPGPEEAIVRGLLEAPNATGGICGRKIVPTIASFDGLTTGGDSKACSKLTEDTKQFVVLAVNGVAEPALRCLADQGKTLTISDSPNQSQSFANGVDGRYFSTAADVNNGFDASPRILEEAGVLQKGGKIGLIYDGSADNQAVVDAITTKAVPKLESIADKVTTCVMPGGAASSEGSAALPLCVEKFVAAGVDTIVNAMDIYSFSLMANEAKKQGLNARYLSIGGFGCCDTTTKLFFHKVSQPANFDGMVSIEQATENAKNAYVDECLARVTKFGVKPAPADMTDFQRLVVVSFCWETDLLFYGLAAAGPAPTQVSYISGLEHMPAFATVGGWNGSFGPHKHFFLDELRLATYGAAKDSFSPLNPVRYAVG
jgi:ABC-type branched-subunit amino acid transport system substrate-binding protein